MRITDKHTFFVATKEPFSNWHACTFTHGGITFSSSEQFMMYHKAMLFKDVDTAFLVLKTKDPAKQKELGRQIKNFDAEIWSRVAYEVVKPGVYEKFAQNPHLKEALMATGNTLLVEAAHYDTVWGIGMRETDEGVDDPKNWKGGPDNNKLGRMLTEVREQFKLEMLVQNNIENVKKPKA